MVIKKMHHGYRSLQFEHTLDHQAGTTPRLELERNHLAALPDLSYSHTLLTHNRTASRDIMVSFERQYEVLSKFACKEVKVRAFPL